MPRVFGFVGLHFHANWQLAACRRFVTQGVPGSMKIPIPVGGGNVDIGLKALELSGALPPLPDPGPECVKKPQARRFYQGQEAFVLTSTRARKDRPVFQIV